MSGYVEAASVPRRNNGQIKLYTESDFAGMRRAGALAARCLDEVATLVRPGIRTEQIDQFIYDFGLSTGRSALCIETQDTMTDHRMDP